MASPIVCIESFNRIIKRLAVDLGTRFPADAKVDRVKKRIILAASVAPNAIIDEVGKYLFDYRNEIYSGDAQFFLENEYDSELESSVDQEKRDLSMYLIPKIKQAWKSGTEREQTAYLELVQDLLDIYLDYVSAKLTR